MYQGTQLTPSMPSHRTIQMPLTSKLKLSAVNTMPRCYLYAAATPVLFLPLFLQAADDAAVPAAMRKHASH
jgi:hypothetical protein